MVRAIDKDILSQEINREVVESNDERYSFSWPDKRKSIIEANRERNKTLRPLRSLSIDFDDTENLYIEGDNLEVLKLLEETYFGKVKVIYIDPPYNTGTDLVYNDNYTQSVSDWDKESGERDDLVKKGEMEGKISKNNINESSSFSSVKTYKGNEKIKRSSLKYDLIGRIAEETRLKRKTIGEILYKMNDDKFKMFSFDSEKFISLITKIINSEKVRLVLDDIVYDKTNEEYRSDVLLSDISILSENVVYGEKLVQSFTDVDGSAKDSIEKKFLKDLDSAEEVSSYAKLPRSFSIPTPLGNYTPDWAIAFNDNSGIKHIYFIAETKGSMDTDQLRWIEKAKTECAKKLFNEQKKAGKVRYGVADSYENLFSLIKSIK